MKYLIEDVFISDLTRQRFVSMGFSLLHFQSLVRDLEVWPGWQSFQREKTILVFAGNGGSKVRSHLHFSWLRRWPWKVGAFAKRFWRPGLAPYAIAHKFANGVYVGMTDVVIVDDVVSSGVTARRIMEANAPWVPNAKWHIATLIGQRSAALRGFASRFAVVEVGLPEKKAPLNSISTLLDEPEIAADYAKRNCGGYIQPFLELLHQLRYCDSPFHGT